MQHEFLQQKLKATLLRQQPLRTFDTAAADRSVCFLINSWLKVKFDGEFPILQTALTIQAKQLLPKACMKALYHGPCEGVWVNQRGPPAWTSLHKKTRKYVNYIRHWKQPSFLHVITYWLKFQKSWCANKIIIIKHWMMFIKQTQDSWSKSNFIAYKVSSAALMSGQLGALWNCYFWPHRSFWESININDWFKNMGHHFICRIYLIKQVLDSRFSENKYKT